MLCRRLDEGWMEVLDVSSGSGGWRADADGVGRKSGLDASSLSRLSGLRTQNGLGRGGFFVRPLNLSPYQGLMKVPNEIHYAVWSRGSLQLQTA